MYSYSLIKSMSVQCTLRDIDCTPLEMKLDLVSGSEVARLGRVRDVI